MEVLSFPSARDFLDATGEYRAAQPLLTNLLGSIAEGVTQGREYLSESWLAVVNGGMVIGAAVRTAPYNLVLGPMPLEAAAALGRYVAADPVAAADLPGVAGPEPVVAGVLAELDRPWLLSMRDVLRVLETLVLPSAAPAGSLRPAGDADAELLAGWHRAFLREAGLPVVDEEQGAPRLGAGGGALWVWEVHREPVAMAGHAPLVRTPGGVVGRIGPVYTVPDHRGRGYASAATAAVTSELLRTCDHVMLFADASNATSNGVYERLGFVAVGEQVEVSLH